MSWMDSWSRPNKQSATPPPLYLTSGDVKYCQACGRVIGDRRSHKKNEIVKYCSDGCRRRRLGPVDKKIDKAIFALLQGAEGSGVEAIDVQSRRRKGNHRNVITCDEIENIVFEREQITVPEADEANDETDPYALQDEDAMDSEGRRPNPPNSGSSQKQQAGQRRAEEREMVRRAARRAVVFGFPEQSVESGVAPQRRKCEAVMSGRIVEPSFAKGNWSIRWRE